MDLSFLPIVLMMVVMYFLLIRPKQKELKKLEELVRQLEKGDRVITQSGIIGRIWEIKEDSFILAIEAGAKLEITKASVTQVAEK